jgi:hypothetical protein
MTDASPPQQPEPQCDGYSGDSGASAPRCESYQGHPGRHFIRPFVTSDRAVEPPLHRKPGCIYKHPHDHECRNQDDMMEPPLPVDPGSAKGLLRPPTQGLVKEGDRTPGSVPLPVDPEAVALLREAHRGDWCQLPGEVWNRIDRALARASVPLPVDGLREALGVLRRQPWFGDAAWDSADVISALAAPTPTAPALGVEAEADYDYHANIIWRVPVPGPGVYRIARLSGTEPGE